MKIAWRGDLQRGDQCLKAWCECKHHVDYHDDRTSSCLYPYGNGLEYCLCLKFQSHNSSVNDAK